MSGTGPGQPDDPMHAEFDTVAGWTADVALDLGPDSYLAAGCRGSASPGALRWLLDRLEAGSSDRLLDCGAGVGGPAAFAAREVGVRPVLTEPEHEACRAARRLFGLPVVRAASRLPFGPGAFDLAWSLGVLCTVDDQPGLLAELRRVLGPDGRLGLLVFVAETDRLEDPPTGNNFPTEARLERLLDEAGLVVLDSASAADFASSPPAWQEQEAAVEAALEARHADDPAFQTAARQSAAIGRLLQTQKLAGRLLVARPRTERER
jgi:SAM-dependent methyltransferase